MQSEAGQDQNITVEYVIFGEYAIVAFFFL